MKRWLKRLFVLSATLAFCGGGCAWWALQQSQQVPEFYTRAKLQIPTDLAAVSESLKHGVEKLQDSAARPGSWLATFTEEQINAWLAKELPQEFPKMLPPGVEEPRIVIEDDHILAAARMKNSHIDTVISLVLKVELTDQANVLAVRIEQLRAGSLALPIKGFLRGISTEAKKSNIDVVWDMDDTGPVALVSVPSEHPRFVTRPVIIESVAVQAGCVNLAGYSGPEAWNAYSPRSPIYQLASARVGRKDQSHVESTPR